MRYQRCKYFDGGYCYNMGLRNGLNTLGCVGYDRCEAYETDLPLKSRIDQIGQNGNDGEHYMSSPVECEECGATLQFDGDNWSCPNDDCLSVTGDKVIVHEPGMVFIKEDAAKEFFSDAVERLDNYRPTVGAEDVVNEPSHYKIAGIEVIDIIEAALTEEAFNGYLIGNILKYRLRAGKKDNVEQDIAKAMRYEQWLK